MVSSRASSIAFFAASPVMKQAGLTDAQLLDAIHAQLKEKFGSKVAGPTALAILERALGIAVDGVRLVGGGARNRLWRRILADALDAPLDVMLLERLRAPQASETRSSSQTPPSTTRVPPKPGTSSCGCLETRTTPIR